MGQGSVRLCENHYDLQVSNADGLQVFPTENPLRHRTDLNHPVRTKQRALHHLFRITAGLPISPTRPSRSLTKYPLSSLPRNRDAVACRVGGQCVITTSQLGAPNNTRVIPATQGKHVGQIDLPPRIGPLGLRITHVRVSSSKLARISGNRHFLSPLNPLTGGSPWFGRFALKAAILLLQAYFSATGPYLSDPRSLSSLLKISCQSNFAIVRSTFLAQSASKGTSAC